jgi:hypothetical protein
MTTPPAARAATDLRVLLLARLDALGDQAAALGLAVAEHPGPIAPLTLETVLAAVEGACRFLATARGELPAAGGPEAAGAGQDTT